MIARRTTAALAVALVLGAACASQARQQDGAARTIVGVVVDVKSAGLGEVESFSLKRREKVFEIFIDPSARYSFPPAHLNDHLASAQPVRVRAVERDGRLVATAIEDA